MAAFPRTSAGLRSLGCYVRGWGAGLASCVMPSLMFAVCFFVALNGLPAGMLLPSQTAVEEATGESCDEELGAVVELFGRPRRSQSFDEVSPLCSAPMLILPGARSSGVGHRVHAGQNLSLPPAINGCGAILRC